MRRSIYIILFFIPLSYSGQVNILKTDSAIIDFISEAPLEFISATSNECSGIIDKSENTFAFRVKIRSFEGFNSPLQKEHFNENYLESEEVPNATYVGKILDPIDYNSSGTYNISTKGTLAIHGVEDERIIDLTLRIDNDGKLHFRGMFEIELVTHDIEVPRIVYQKISEIIQISIKGVMF